MAGGIDIEVRHIRPSHLDEWLALHESRLKNTSYNRYAGLVKQLFEIAVKDRIIAESPCPVRVKIVVNYERSTRGGRGVACGVTGSS